MFDRGGIALTVALVASACDATAPVDDVVWADAGVACAGSTMLYLNPNGGRYGSGVSDAVANTTEILEGGRIIDVPSFPGDDATWDQVLACARAMVSNYDLTVTDVDPGAVAHMEIAVTTVGPDLDLPYTYSVSPRSCQPNPRGVAFVFAGAHQNQATAICMTAVRDLGHLLGLEHVISCEDVMSEAPGCDPGAPERRFLDADAPCGLIAATDCTCSTSRTQNSHRRMLTALGSCTP